MKEIPLYKLFSIIQLINKGMSGDKKYYIETIDNKHMLLRIADVNEYTQKNAEFELVKQLSTQGIPMPTPIDFGTCDNGKSVYTLLSWIEGVEVEAVLPNLSRSERYALGIESGKILRRIHDSSVNQTTNNWVDRYYSVIGPRLEAFRSEGIPFEGDALILDYLESNRDLLKKRPQCHHHGDYHMGNMILTDNGHLSIIDWHTVDFDNFGDPWYEFNRIGIDYAEFASGQINGYFDHEVPEDFWKLLAYYLSASAITSIVWAKYFAQERLEDIMQLNADVLSWFDNMKNPVPTWYLRV